jgi:nucleotide-binding universal stress UspA family protein
MRIFVPLDGSPLSERALLPAVHLLRRATEPDSIILARIASNPFANAHIQEAYSQETVTGIIEENTEASLDYLREVSHRPIFSGIKVTILATTGEPAAMISAKSVEYKADLIVMTSHGRSGGPCCEFGDIAEGVMREAQISTLFVRPEGETFPDIGRFEPLTMLVPLDGSPLAESALQPAMLVATRLHGSIRLVQVLEPSGQHSELEQRRAHEAFEYLTQIHEQLEEQGITAHRAIAWGHPGEQIILETERRSADLVVIATRGLPVADSAENASVTDFILHHVNLPVLVVHPCIIPEESPV